MLQSYEENKKLLGLYCWYVGVMLGVSKAENTQNKSVNYGRLEAVQCQGEK